MKDDALFDLLVKSVLEAKAKQREALMAKGYSFAQATDMIDRGEV